MILLYKMYYQLDLDMSSISCSVQGIYIELHLSLVGNSGNLLGAEPSPIRLLC
jgi:hypothetical protein